MQYTTLKEFLQDWGYESASTQKLFANISDASMKQAVSPGGRTLGRLGWHIIESVPEMMERTGLKVFTPDMEHFKLMSSADMQKCYKNVCDSLVEKLKDKWNDETLLVEDDMYGQQWKRGTTLSVLIVHQTHHRAQMTVLMRQAGLKVPGVYGPAKEEWASIGMEPME